MTKAKNQEQKEESKKAEKKAYAGILVRILSTDLPGNKSVYAGLTKINGVSWSFSNAVCRALKIDKKKKIEELSKEEIKKIEDFFKNPEVKSFLKNRRKEMESGKDLHLIGSDLDLRKEFDIKRLKKIRAYRGMRHALGLPVRGQRTKAHFRKGRAVGVKKGKMRKSGK